MKTKSSAKGRKLILVRTDLLEKAIKECSKQGKTMFAFTNQIFESALKAYEMETDLEEILEFYSFVKLGKNLGVAMLPSSLINYMLETLYKLDRENLIAKAYESGLWFGKCLLLKFPEENVTEKLEGILKKYMWHSLDLTITNKGDTIELNCISPILSEEKTHVISKFIEGAFQAFNYEVVKNSCFRGIISMELKNWKPRNSS